jgi:quinol monooxygenase YgiN
MNNLQITARYQIHLGKLAEFKKIAEECHSIVKAKDKDTLQYDWYFDESQTECVLRETYPDSNALLAHLGNIGEMFGKLVALGDFSAEVYGQPSEELLQATSGLNIKVYTFFQGI